MTTNIDLDEIVNAVAEYGFAGIQLDSKAFDPPSVSIGINRLRAAVGVSIERARGPYEYHAQKGNLLRKLRELGLLYWQRPSNVDDGSKRLMYDPYENRINLSVAEWARRLANQPADVIRSLIGGEQYRRSKSP